LKSVWPYLWKYRRGMALGMGALLMTDLMKAALPLAIRSGIDSLMKGFRLSLVFEFAALVVLLSVVKGIFQYWMRVILIGFRATSSSICATICSRTSSPFRRISTRNTAPAISWRAPPTI
jgi:ABC-type multidrug transport system fused ATPase/permease subunit